jgi:hypothetical protein
VTFPMRRGLPSSVVYRSAFSGKLFMTKSLSAPLRSEETRSNYEEMRLGHETGLLSEVALTPLRSIERQKSKGNEESRAIEAACNVVSMP